jgi:hypothetical protein
MGCHSLIILFCKIIIGYVSLIFKNLNLILILKSKKLGEELVEEMNHFSTLYE